MAILGVLFPDIPPAVFVLTPFLAVPIYSHWRKNRY